MVEPDLPIAGGDQRIGHGRSLVGAGGDVRQRCHLDQALIFLEGYRSSPRWSELTLVIAKLTDRQPATA